MSTIEKLQELISDADSMFSSNKVVPKTGYFIDEDCKDSIHGCALTAAYVKSFCQGNPPKLEDFPSADVLKRRIKSQYGIGESAIEGIVSGFDKQNVSEQSLKYHKDRQGFCAAYTLSKELSKKYIKEE